MASIATPLTRRLNTPRCAHRYEGRLLRLRISGDHCYPVSPPRVAFTRRVIHLNFDVAPSGETFVAQLLNTWSGMCDVKWLLDRIVQLLREPEPDLVPAAARPENALARDGDEDGDGGIDDEAGARGTQPLGNDLRVKRQADRLAAELFRLHRDRPRRYKALARQHALAAGDHYDARCPPSAQTKQARAREPHPRDSSPAERSPCGPCRSSTTATWAPATSRSSSPPSARCRRRT